MKRNLRKILSLVLMVVMLCSVMVPGAMAATTTDWAGLGCYFGYHSYKYIPQYGYVCEYCYTPYSSGSAGDIYDHDHTYYAINSTQHQLYCSYGTACSYYGLTLAHSFSSSGVCSDCGYNSGTGSSYDHTHVLSYSQSSDYAGYHLAECTVSGCTYYTYEAHTYNTSGYCTACRYYSGTGTGVTSNLQWTATCTGGTHIPVYYRTSNGYDEYYCSQNGCYATGYALSTGSTGNLQWSNNSYYCDGYWMTHTPVLSYTYGGYNYYTCGNTGCNATATSYASGTGTSSGSAVGEAGKLYVTGYDSMTNDTYTLNETVTLSVYPTMYETTDTTANYDFYYSWSGDVYYTDDDTAYLDTSASTATAYCTVTAYAITDTSKTTPVDTATVYWYATALAGKDIIYSALKGENVVLDVEDFEEFWAEEYPSGTLNYVRFTNVSTGNLYDNYAGGTTLRTDVRARGTSCYLSPTATQVGLDDLTYVPATYGNATTATIQFTAYGSSNYNYGSIWGSNYGNTSLSGTITILYTAKEVTPITYDVIGDTVALDADDFIAKYKEVMGVTYAGNLSIEFLEVPTYGTLTMSYGTGSWYQGSGIKLTSTNIGNYSFGTASAGTYSIDNLTYTPGTASDTIRFACYSGNNLKFVGTVTFGASDVYTVEMTTTAGKAVAMSTTDFYKADSTGVLTSGYLYLGTPTAGTLYKNYANGTGTYVTANDYFTVSNLSTVTYVPRTGFVGVAELPYTAYTYAGQQIKGTVKIYVGRSFTDIAGTSHVWAQPYIDKLSAQNVVKGTGDGTTYEPGKELSYGEALTMIMRAAGYSEQAPVNKHWASGFLTKAYYDGLVSSSAIDLDAAINRDAVAEITAKALKLNYATSVNYGVTAPSDSTNGYVYALYNAGIVNGVNVGAYNYWYGSRSITRAEISKIVCMISDYAATK